MFRESGYRTITGATDATYTFAKGKISMHSQRCIHRIKNNASHQTAFLCAFLYGYFFFSTI